MPSPTPSAATPLTATNLTVATSARPTSTATTSATGAPDWILSKEPQPDSVLQNAKRTSSLRLIQLKAF